MRERVACLVLLKVSYELSPIVLENFLQFGCLEFLLLGFVLSVSPRSVLCFKNMYFA